jgi:hypothetical protein
MMTLYTTKERRVMTAARMIIIIIAVVIEATKMVETIRAMVRGVTE